MAWQVVWSLFNCYYILITDVAVIEVAMDAGESFATAQYILLLEGMKLTRWLLYTSIVNHDVVTMYVVRQVTCTFSVEVIFTFK